MEKMHQLSDSEVGLIKEGMAIDGRQYSRAFDSQKDRLFKDAKFGDEVVDIITMTKGTLMYELGGRRFEIGEEWKLRASSYKVELDIENTAKVPLSRPIDLRNDPEAIKHQAIRTKYISAYK